MLPNLNPLTEVIDNIVVDTHDVEQQEVSNELVDWYVNRFIQAFDDGCPAAVTAYLDHLLHNDKCNTLTRSCIISKAYDLQSAYEERSSTHE